MHTVFLFWENELQSMDTIVFTGLLSTEGQVPTPLQLLHEWWIRHEYYKGSGVPFDQALEQCYNRPAKVSGGIIGVTRKKDAVALWGIIKHKKDQFVDLLKKKNDIQEELSLHHDFNPSTTTMIISMVRDIEQYLLKVCNPLQDQTVLKNILTGEVVTNVKVDKLICCIREGREAYTRFLNDRLKEKSLYQYIQPLAKSSLQLQRPY